MLCLSCDATIAADSAHLPCSRCGSLDRGVEVVDTSTMRELTHSKLRKAKCGRPALEVKSGDSRDHRTGRWNTVEQRIDREHNRYYKHVEDPSTGEVLRHADEPLSEHKGYGSAKLIRNPADTPHGA